MGEALEIGAGSLADTSPEHVSAAIRLHTDETGGGLIASPPPSLSNAPLLRDPHKGAPFGGWMAAATVAVARQALDCAAPLRTVTIQFMAGAKFAPVSFHAERLRGGRSTLFAGVRAHQEDKPILASLLTFGEGGPGPEHQPLIALPPHLDRHREDGVDDRIAPWFTRAVEYRFETRPDLMGGAEDAVVRGWFRVRDPGPLDELKLCFLLDAVFPNFFVVKGPIFATSVDLRYDLFGSIGPDASPEGWVFFDFRTRDCADGWAVEDGTASAPDGRPLAVARQLRKILAKSRSAAL